MPSSNLINPNLHESHVQCKRMKFEEFEQYNNRDICVDESDSQFDSNEKVNNLLHQRKPKRKNGRGTTIIDDFLN